MMKLCRVVFHLLVGHRWEGGICKMYKLSMYIAEWNLLFLRLNVHPVCAMCRVSECPSGEEEKTKLLRKRLTIVFVSFFLHTF